MSMKRAVAVVAIELVREARPPGEPDIEIEAAVGVRIAPRGGVQIGLDTSLWVFRILMFGLGIGMAYVFLPNQAASQATISREDAGPGLDAVGLSSDGNSARHLAWQ